MVDAATRASFERQDFEGWAMTGVPDTADWPLAAGAWLTHAAFVQPERQVAIIDALADAMAAPIDARIGRVVAALAPTLDDGLPAATVPTPLWDGFWAIAGAPPDAVIDPVAFTLRVVALGQLYDDALIARCEAALLRHACVPALLALPERRLRTADLECYPDGSLGAALLTMLRAQGYDLEVIDADSVVLPGWPAQNRTNRAILQLHDVWHLLAGYGFTGAGEVAISGFQLAQFGQNYSTRFLAATVTLAALSLPPLADMLLGVALDGWRHGRATPDLMARPWPELLGRDIATLRNELGVTPFASETARMMEGMEAAAKAA